MWTNAQKLSAVLTEWMRPAVSQIAAHKIMDLSAMKSLQAVIGGSGLVSGDYSLQADIQPMIEPVVNALVQPMLHKYISNVPDESIPQMAHSIVDSLKQKGSVTILDGLVTFEHNDLCELSDLLDFNLPIEEEGEPYKVIH